MTGRRGILSVVGVMATVLLLMTGATFAAETGSGSAADSGFWRALTLRDYNTRVVLAGTCLLGLAGGVVGTFMLLRKRSLEADVASHAAFPGIGLAFLLTEAFRPGLGKSLPILLAGAFATALLGIGCTHLLTRIRRIREDAALGMVLGVFFGAGVVLLTIIQGLPSGHQAGLSDFVFGKAAALVASDMQVLAGCAVVVVVLCGVSFKALTLLCFDREFAEVQGWPVRGLDWLLTLLIVSVTVIGMQSVGLLLVVALTIIPSAASRFWSDRLPVMVAVAGGLGALSGLLGVLVSAAAPRLAAGAVIVLSASAVFGVSLLLGPRGGAVWEWLRRRSVRVRVGLLDLLRTSYELQERRWSAGEVPRAAELSDFSFTADLLRQVRSWSPARVASLLHYGILVGVIRPDSAGSYRLTEEGGRQALEAVRQHRLWELYLIHYAELPPLHVDSSADLTEHALHPQQIEQLERLLSGTVPPLPPNPHAPIGHAPAIIPPGGVA